MSNTPRTDNDLACSAIPGCHDCPFFAEKYCGLAIWLNAKDGVYREGYREEECSAQVTPNDCPLHEKQFTFRLQEKD